eukprot:2137374-Prymnesium_polylepis.1
MPRAQWCRCSQTSSPHPTLKSASKQSGDLKVRPAFDVARWRLLDSPPAAVRLELPDHMHVA